MFREVTLKIKHIFDMAFSLYKVILNYLVIFYHAKVYNNLFRNKMVLSSFSEEVKIVRK